MMRPYGSQISDETLMGTLDLCAYLSDHERAAVVAAMARFVEHGRLTTQQRDHLFAIAKSYNLFAHTEMRPRRDKPLGFDGLDNYSTRPGKVDPRCLVRPTAPPVRRSA